MQDGKFYDGVVDDTHNNHKSDGSHVDPTCGTYHLYECYGTAQNNIIEFSLLTYLIELCNIFYSFSFPLYFTGHVMNIIMVMQKVSASSVLSIGLRGWYLVPDIFRCPKLLFFNKCVDINIGP